MKLRDNLSIVMMVRNEGYWIDYTLKPLLEANLDIYIADMGSNDNTVEIIHTINSPLIHFYDLSILTNDEKIREILAYESNTPWYLQIDCDEIMLREGLQSVLDTEMGDYKGGWIVSQNVVWENSALRLANKASHRRIHQRETQWYNRHGNENVRQAAFPKTWYYLPHPKGEWPEREIVPGERLTTKGPPHQLHLRFLRRSSADTISVIRKRKFGIYKIPKGGPVIDIFKIYGAPRFYNPYWEYLRHPTPELLAELELRYWEI